MAPVLRHPLVRIGSNSPVNQVIAHDFLNTSIEKLTEITYDRICTLDDDAIHNEWCIKANLTDRSIVKVVHEDQPYQERIRILNSVLDLSIDSVQFTIASLKNTGLEKQPPVDWEATLTINAFFLIHMDKYFPYERDLKGRPIYKRDEESIAYMRKAKEFKSKITLLSEGIKALVCTIYKNKFADRRHDLTPLLGESIIDPSRINIDFCLDIKDIKTLRTIR